MTPIWFFWAIINLFIDPRYHTYEEAVAEIDSLVSVYPAITALDTLCLSTRDSLLVLAVKISDNPDINEDEPALLFNGIHHGEEILGGEVCFYLLNELLSKYGLDSLITYWINETEIWIIPMLNPEGQTVVMTGIDTIWRKNKRDNNNNGFFDTDSDGVDVNRNYDFNWELGGSGDPASENYRGTAPFSENETRGIRDLSLEEHFVFDICYHNVRTGQGELVYYPWRWGAQFCVDYEFIKKVADTLASRIINDAGNATYVPIYGYAAEGTARNWHYGVNGTFAFTIEVSRSCYPPGDMVDSICIRNLAGIYYLLGRVFGASITGIVTDTFTNQPLAAEVRIAGYYDSTLAPRESEPVYGRYRRIVNAGTYSLTFVKNNYATQTISDVVVQPGIPTNLNVKMVPLAVAEETGGRKQVIGLNVYPTVFHDRMHIRCTIHDAGSMMEKAPQQISGSVGSLRHPPSIAADAWRTGYHQPALKIYDATGRIVRELSFYLVSGIVDHVSIISWYGTDDFDRSLPPGVYFVRLDVGSQHVMEKVIKLE